MARSPFTIGAAATVQVGELRERIRIDAKGQTTDEMGGQDTGWTPFTVTWAKVLPMPLRADEQIEGGGLAAVYQYLFTIRRRLDLVPTMRIVWPVSPVTGADVPASLTFNLRAISLPYAGDFYMVLKAESGVAV